MHAGDESEIFRILEGGNRSKGEKSGQKAKKSGRWEIEVEDKVETGAVGTSHSDAY